jgi:hypothetical protein
VSQRKEHILLELKELLSIVLYLAASFSLLATFRSLILIQLGINDFVHGYLKALIEAIALGKIVLLTQNIRVLNTFDNKSLLVSSLFKSAVMTIIVFLGGKLEEKIFTKHIEQLPLQQELVIMIAHILGLFAVFYVLFLARGLDTALGSGRLRKLLTEPHPSNSASPIAEPPLACVTKPPA